MWVCGYLIMGVVALACVIIGIRAIIRRQIKISDKEYQGPRARTIGAELIFAGVAILGLMLFMMSLLR
jgi:hypothetical protein